MTGFIAKAMRSLVLLLSKMSGCIKTFKVKNGDKDKSNKLKYFHIDYGELLGKYKTIWTKIEDLKIIKLNSFSVYDDTYVKFKIRRYRDKIYIHPVVEDLIFLSCLLKHAQLFNHCLAVSKTLQNETFKYFKSIRYISLDFSLLQHF